MKKTLNQIMIIHKGIKVNYNEENLKYLWAILRSGIDDSEFNKVDKVIINFVTKKG